jgi:hypothetical protein
MATGWFARPARTSTLATNREPDSRPLNRATEVALDAHHQLADVTREVEIARVFRG